MSELEERGEEDEEEEEERGGERISYEAYFGAATGLVIGLVAAMLIAWEVSRLWPGSRAAEMVWEVGSAVFALLGLLLFGSLFYTHLRGQIVLPACLFLATLALGLLLAIGPIGFPWRDVG